jgi:hypothetical protein
MKKKGQVALIVLIVSAIVMTIGLSLSKKSVVDTKINVDQELLKQAFNAAESGVDYYLGTGSTAYVASDQQSAANVKVTTIGGGSGVVNLGAVTLANNFNYTWLVAHNPDGSLNMLPFGATAMSICVDNGFNGSLMINYFYKSVAGYQVYRTGYNVVTPDRVSGFTNVAPASGSCPGIGTMKQITLGSLPLAGVQPMLLAVKPIGSSTKMVTMADAVFPDQEMEISSTGRAGDVQSTTGVRVNREVNVINQYQIPSFMMEAVTAAGNVLSN